MRESAKEDLLALSSSAQSFINIPRGKKRCPTSFLLRSSHVELKIACHQKTDFTIAETPAMSSATWASVGSVPF